MHFRGFLIGILRLFNWWRDSQISDIKGRDNSQLAETDERA
jgi:hypothetical protein